MYDANQVQVSEIAQYPGKKCLNTYWGHVTIQWWPRWDYVLAMGTDFYWNYWYVVNLGAIITLDKHRFSLLK